MQAPLDQDDLEWLTKAHTRLKRMRKREVATEKRTYSVVEVALTEAIDGVQEAHEFLESRLKTKS